MLHDLTLIEGGRHTQDPEPGTESEHIHLVRSSRGFRPPDADAILSLLLEGFLPRKVQHLATAVVPVFLEMCGERWALSSGDVGLTISLSTEPYLPKPETEGLRRRMNLPEPEWSMRVREGEPGGVRYHIHLPPYVGDGRVVVPIARFWGPPNALWGVRNLVSFKRDGSGWMAFEHFDTKPWRGVVDTEAVSPFHLRWHEQDRLSDGAPRPRGA